MTVAQQRKQRINSRWRALHLEQSRECSRQYQKNNRQKRNVRLYKKRQIDPHSRLMEALRSGFRRVLRGNAKSATSLDLIGCTWAELWRWLEFQFSGIMTRENYGSVWHVDHIRPCASFDMSDSEQQKECFHFSNLQPLLVRDNLIKGSKYASGF